MWERSRRALTKTERAAKIVAPRGQNLEGRIYWSRLAVAPSNLCRCVVHCNSVLLKSTWPLLVAMLCRYSVLQRGWMHVHTKRPITTKHNVDPAFPGLCHFLLFHRPHPPLHLTSYFLPSHMRFRINPPPLITFLLPPNHDPSSLSHHPEPTKTMTLSHAFGGCYCKANSV